MLIDMMLQSATPITSSPLPLHSPDGGASTRTSFQISVVRCAVHIAKKESKSGHVLRGKRRRLDIEDIVPTLTANAADESNVEDRSLSVFCFSVRYCIIAICRSTFEVLEYICA